MGEFTVRTHDPAGSPPLQVTTAGRVRALAFSYSRVPEPSFEPRSRRYHCLVNLACCLVSLNQPRPARALLEQAGLCSSVLTPLICFCFCVHA